jgi:hypothetical protein
LDREWPDLLLHVSTPDLSLRADDTSLTVTGNLRTGTEIAGIDRVTVLK